MSMREWVTRRLEATPEWPAQTRYEYGLAALPTRRLGATPEAEATERAIEAAWDVWDHAATLPPAVQKAVEDTLKELLFQREVLRRLLPGRR